MRLHLTALLSAASLLAGCQNQAFKEIGQAPSMSPIGSGLQYTQTPQLASYPKQPHQMTAGYSLWNDQQAALFKDARAINVGDILTVDIQIDDKASFNNETDRSRTNSSGFNLGAGGESQTSDFEWSGNLKYGSNTKTEGDGKTERSEKLRLLVAAVVTGVLENGNLLINVAGIVRPRDVDADNIISYDRIAEARISYGGRGRLMEVQQPPWGQQVVDLVSPI